MFVGSSNGYFCNDDSRDVRSQSRCISVGGSLVRASYAAVRRAAAEMVGAGTFAYAAEAIPDGEMSALMAGEKHGER